MAERTKRTRNVYLVMGDNGKEYEDHLEWLVCGYLDKPSALRHVALATEHCRNVENPYDDNVYGSAGEDTTTTYGVRKLRLLDGPDSYHRRK